MCCVHIVLHDVDDSLTNSFSFSKHIYVCICTCSRRSIPSSPRSIHTHMCVAAAAKGVSETFATHSLHLDDIEEYKSMYKSFDA